MRGGLPHFQAVVYLGKKSYPKANAKYFEAKYFYYLGNDQNGVMAPPGMVLR